MRFIDAQEKLGIVIENQRDLSWDYLGKDKDYNPDIYPECEFVANTNNLATEDSAKMLALNLGGTAFFSEPFHTPAGEIGGRWFIKWPAGLMLDAGSVGLVWNSRIDHYIGLINNWNLKGRDGRAAGIDPEQQNPIITTTIKLAEELR